MTNGQRLAGFLLAVVCIGWGPMAVSSAEAAGEKRRAALVIGNSAYKQAPLRNPRNDADAVARALEEARFEVTKVTDATAREMFLSIDLFVKSLTADTISLVYFAGHGLQIDNANYLIPVDAEIKTATDVLDRTVPVSYILSKLEGAKAEFNILILDACRNSPFDGLVQGDERRRARAGAVGLPRSTGQGLAQQDAPVGTLLAFATAPGRTASDGAGENGLYTQALVQVIGEKGLRIEEVFKRVRALVRERSHGAQIPWENTSLIGEFYFHYVPPVTKEVRLLPPPYTPYYDDQGKLKPFHGRFTASAAFWAASGEASSSGERGAFIGRIHCTSWDGPKTVKIELSPYGEMNFNRPRRVVSETSMLITGRFPVFEIQTNHQRCASITLTMEPE